MALTTRGTSIDGRLKFTILSEGSYIATYGVIRGGYTITGYASEMAEDWWFDIKRGATSIYHGYFGYTGVTYTVELIGATFKIYEGATLVATATDPAPLTASGVWQTDSNVQFISFENLDGASTFAVGISSGGNGTVSKSSVNVTGTVSDTFVATPSAGYRLASLTKSAGVTTSPTPDGTVGAKTITVNATQVGTVVANFVLDIPTKPVLSAETRVPAGKTFTINASGPMGAVTGWKFSLDDVLVSTQASGTYVYTPVDGSVHSLSVIAYNANGESVASDSLLLAIPLNDPAWWTTATPTVAAGSSKTAFLPSDVVGAGGFVFGDSNDTSKMYWVANPLKLTDDGYAIQSVSAVDWMSGWLAHDKTLPFECEVEYFSTQAGIDAGLVLYSSEVSYRHTVKQSPTYGAPQITWTPPRPSEASTLNKWVKWGYSYYTQQNGQLTEAWYVGKLTVDGVTYTSSPARFAADITKTQHPVVAPSTWTMPTNGNIVAFRNLKVVSGHLAAFSVDFGRWSSTEAIATIRANGGGTWTYQQRTIEINGSTVNVGTFVNGGLTMWGFADEQACIEGSGTVELPLVTIPDGLLPKTLNFKSNQLPWKIVDDLGVTKMSGQSTNPNGVTSIDISGITSRTIRPVFTLDTAITPEPTLYWADFSWDYSILSATNLTITKDGANVVATWTDNADNNDGYLVQYDADGAGWTDSVTIGDVSTYTFAPTWTQSIRFRLAPYNAYGTGVWVEAVLASKSVALQSDAIVKKVSTAAVSADSLAKQVLASGVQADSIVKRAASLGVEADAVAKVVDTVAVAADLALAARLNSGVVADAVVKSVRGQEVGADALVRDSFSSELQVDSILTAVSEASVSADALVQRSCSAEVKADAFMTDASVKSVSADALVKRIAVANVEATASLKHVRKSDIQAEAIVKSPLTVTFAVDAVAMKTAASAVQADAFVALVTQVELEIDAVVKRVALSSIHSDAMLKDITSTTVFADAVVAGRHYAEIQAVTSLVGAGERSVLADAIIRSGLWSGRLVGTMQIEFDNKVVGVVEVDFENILLGDMSVE